MAISRKLSNLKSGNTSDVLDMDTALLKVYAQRFFTPYFFITKRRQGQNKYISVNFNAFATHFHI